MSITNKPRTSAAGNEIGLTVYSMAFAKALAVFLRELNLLNFLPSIRKSQSNENTITYESNSEDKIPQSWDDLPAELRQEIEAEIMKNNELLAAGEIDAMEVTADSAVIAVTNRLRRVADERGIKQKDIAEKLNISPSVVNKIFKDPERSKVATIRRIADALDVDLHEII